MTTDNRANELTEAQARAVRKLDNVQAILAGAQASVTDAVRELSLVSAALLAAHGAAPQAESADCDRDRMGICKRCGMGWDARKVLDGDFACPVLLSSTESPVEPFKTWFACWWKNEPNAIAESNAQSAFYAGWDARGLPSSGVDEEKLADVIEQHVLGEPNGGTASWAWVNCSCGHRVEVAGVTREHVVALGRKHQSRAVAEWLRGQGR